MCTSYPALHLSVRSSTLFPALQISTQPAATHDPSPGRLLTSAHARAGEQLANHVAMTHEQNRFVGKVPCKIPPTSMQRDPAHSIIVAVEHLLTAALAHAGRQLAKDLAQALEQRRPVLDIPSGVYRLTEESLPIFDSHDFTIRAPGVELMVEHWGTLFRLLGNTNFALEGALTQYRPSDRRQVEDKAGSFRLILPWKVGQVVSSSSAAAN